MKFKKIMLFFSVVFMLTNLVGCATPTNYKAMIVIPTSAIKPNPKLKEAIAVANVAGGKKSTLAAHVDNESLKKAMEGSLSAYGYLSSPDKAKYKLSIALLELDRPVFFGGLTMNVKSVAEYRMFGSNMDKKFRITTIGTAKLSDAYIGNDRMRIASERAIEENIKEFLKKLSAFK